MIEPRGSGERGICAMQDETHIGGEPRGYAGGKWKRQASSAAEDAKTALDATSATVKDRARNVAEQQKRAGADQIGGVARAIHGAAHEIEQELPRAAGFVYDAASKLEGAAASLRGRSVEDPIRRSKNCARTPRTEPM